jgi:hypothetical protein
MLCSLNLLAALITIATAGDAPKNNRKIDDRRGALAEW